MNTFHSLVVRFCLAALMLTGFCKNSLAGTETTTNYFRLANSLAGSTAYSVQDNKYGQPFYMAMPNAFIKRSTGKVILEVFDTSLVVSGYTQDLYVQIFAYDANGALSSNSPFIRQLHVVYTPGSGVSVDMDAVIIEDAHRLVVKIMDATNNYTTISNTDLVALPNNLALRLEIETERYYLFNPAQAIGFGYSTITNPGNSKVEEIEASWDFVEGAEAYDLEWTYVDDYGSSSPTSGYLSASALKVHFRNNATRVTVTNNSYRIPIVFEHGYIVFRVRAIGHEISLPGLPVLEGKWSPLAEEDDLNDYLGSTPTLTSPNFYHNQCVYKIGNVHVDDALNWQYSATFAEGGKRKIVASYADGTLRSRQMITENNSDKTVVIGESIYDHQGRKAVDILPVPEPNGLNTFEYHPLFNKSSRTGTPVYDKQDFDLDAEGDTCLIVPNPLSTSSGAGKYYSDDNTVTGSNGFQWYTPNAFGYAFAQTEYMPDNTGRIRSQSGVGDNHYIGTNHETKYDYATPDQEELDAIFGNDVGKYIHYKKNMVQDANGQVSVSYLDMDGKVIATALAGGNPASLDPLPGATAGAVPTTAHYIKFPGDNAYVNGNTVANNALVFTKDVLIDGLTDYTIHYDVKPESFSPVCTNEDADPICYDCIYDLHISFKDKCGQEYIVPFSSTPDGYTSTQTEGYNELIGQVHMVGGDFVGFQLNSECTAITTHSVTAIVINSLPPGSYTLTKTLTVNMDALNYYVREFEASNCMLPYSDFQDAAGAMTATTGCNTPCANCNAVPTLCEANYRVMLVDVSPGGQYAEFSNTNGVISASAYASSVLNEWNTLPKLANGQGNSNYVPDWKHPVFNGAASVYHYENGMPAYVPVDITDPAYSSNVNVIKITIDNDDPANPNTPANGGTGYFIPLCPTCTTSYVYGVPPHKLKNVTEFKNNWRASFARELVEYHPEFSYYQFCITQAARSEHYYPSTYTNATTSSYTYTATTTSTATPTVTVNVPSAKLTSSANDFTGDWKSLHTLNTFSVTPCPSAGGTSAAYMSSDAFDAFLREKVRSDCEANYFLTGSSSSSGATNIATTPVAYPVNAAALTTDLIDMDPLFRIHKDGSDPTYGNIFVKHKIFGANTYLKLFRFRKMMIDRLQNLGEMPSTPSSGISLNIKQSFYLTGTAAATACQNVYYAPATGSACDITSSPTGSLDAEQWRHYVEYYLAAKQEIVKQMADEFAKVPEFGLYDYATSGVDYFEQLDGTNATDGYIPGSGTASHQRYRFIKGYNGCIGNPGFNEWNSDFIRFDVYNPASNVDPISPGTIYTYTPDLFTQAVYLYLGTYSTSSPGPGSIVGWGIFDDGQGCNVYDKGYYQNKTKRFSSGNDYGQSLTGSSSNNPLDYLGQLQAVADQQYYAQSGSCPLAGELRYLLDQIAKGELDQVSTSDDLSSTNLPLWVSPSFTKRLYDNIVAPANLGDDFKFMLYNASVSTNTLTVSFNYKTDPAASGSGTNLVSAGEAACSSLLTLVKPAGLSSFGDIDEVVSISSTITNVSAGLYGFTLQVKAAGVPFALSGTTCLPLAGCSVDIEQEVCRPSDTGRDLAILMSALMNNAGGSDLLSTSGVDLNTPGSGYEAMLTPAIMSHLGAGASGHTWEWTDGGSHNSFTISSSASSHTLTLTSACTLPLSGYDYQYVESFQKDPATGNILLVINGIKTATGLLTPTTCIVTLSHNDGGGATTVPLMDCEVPELLCDGPEYDNYEAVKDLLNAINVHGDVADNALTPLSTYPEFTPALAAQLGGGPGTAYYIEQGAVVGDQYTYNIVYEVDCLVDGSRTIGGHCYVTACKISYDQKGPGGDPIAMYGDGASVAITEVDVTAIEDGTYYTWTGAWAVGSPMVDGHGSLTVSTCWPVKKCENCNDIQPVGEYTLPDPSTLAATCSTDYANFLANTLVSTSVYTDTDHPLYLTETEFCERGLNACTAQYITYAEAYAAVADAVNDALADPFTPHGAAVLLPENILEHPESYYFIPLDQFCSANSQCLSDYIGYLDALLDDPCLISSRPFCENFPIVQTFAQFSFENCGRYCITHPVISPTPVEEYDGTNNDCVTQLQDIATANANAAYQQYVAGQVATFKNAYITKCLKAAERLNVEYESTKYHYTLYYYDQGGNLIKTVPPEGVAVLTGTVLATVVNNRNATPPTSLTPNHTMATVYTYNSLNQLVSQIIPDHDYDTSNFYYDRLGRMVLSQNPKQAQSISSLKRFSYTKYDALGRITQVGELSSSALHASVSASTHQVSNPLNFAGWINSSSKKQITGTVYDYATYSQSGFQNDLMRGRVASTGIDTDGDGIAENTTHYSYDVHGNVKSQINTDRYNLTETMGDRRTDYEYDLLSGKVNAVHYQDGMTDEFHHRYVYDADNRLLEAWTSRDGYFWDKDAKYFYYLHGPLARTELGSHKVQGIDHFYTIQGWIKGMNGTVLSKVNDPGRDAYVESGGSDALAYLSAEQDIHSLVGVDATSYDLGYFEQTSIGGGSVILHKDYVPIRNGASTGYLAAADPFADISDVTTSNAADLPNLYNGNIKHMGTTIVNPAGINYDYSNHGMPLLQGFYYDQLNRIKKSAAFYGYDSAPDAGLAVINDITDGGFNKWDHSLNAETNFTNYTYDANGNINTLWRRMQNSSYAFADMDNLEYNYLASTNTVVPTPLSGLAYNTNRLGYVEEHASSTPLTSDIENQSSGNYEYDEIGNLEEDAAEQIDNISWNVYGKIEQITRTGASTKPDLEFRYDSKGNRVMKIARTKNPDGSLKDQTLWEYTLYQRDAQGNVMNTYKITYTDHGSGSYTKNLQLIESDIYGSSRIGLFDREAESPIFTEFTADVNATTGFFENIDTDPDPGLSNERVLVSSKLPHELGNKKYELTNHLGNVQTVVTDKKRPVDADSDDENDYYVAEIVSATDYYPFGAPMPGRTFSSSDYRYGFNGQEADNEIAGNGNLYTAEYWEYDTRLGRRWNRDPVDKPWMSPYHAFSNSPIWKVDPNGANDDEVNAVYNEKTKTYDKTTINDKYGPNVTLTHYAGGALDGQHNVFNKGTGSSQWFGGSSSSSGSSGLAVAGAVVGGADASYGKWQEDLDFKNYVTTKGKTRPIVTRAGDIRSATAQQKLNWNTNVKLGGLGLNILTSSLGAFQIYDQYQQGGLSNVSIVDASEVGVGTIGTVANAMSFLNLGGTAAATVGNATGVIGLGFNAGRAWHWYYKTISETQRYNKMVDDPNEAQWNQQMNDQGVMNEGDLYGGK
ncbi:MAG: repeat protein [Bacteroidetes bacterium]|jgi:hypothetical protein|nr:repeat protein [Bacteroidota bacterium]